MKKDKGVKTKRLKVKEPGTFPGCLTKEEVQTLVDS